MTSVVGQLPLGRVLVERAVDFLYFVKIWCKQSDEVQAEEEKKTWRGTGEGRVERRVPVAMTNEFTTLASLTDSTSLQPTQP